MKGLRRPLTSRGFICGPDQQNGAAFNVTVPADFPCYYDVVGKDYSRNKSVKTLTQLRNYLEGALALARTGGAYRTDAEYKDARASQIALRANQRVKTSRFTGVCREIAGMWHASISVRGTKVHLGAFDDEEDAARAYDAARVKYRDEQTINFPGEAPLASVLAALPDLPSPPPPPPPAQTAPAPPPPGAPRRSGRVPAPRVIVDRCVTCNLAPPMATFSRSLTGYRRKTCDTCRAENEAAAAREDEAWKAAGVPADLPALRKAYAREQAAKKLRPRRPSSAPPEIAP